MNTDKHTLGTFDAVLARLRDDFLMMASLTERNLQHAMQGLLQRDDDICNRTIVDEEEIDQLEKQVDRDGVELLLRFQPVASDLRQVLSTMKLSGNLERIADQAVNIAKRARKLNHAPLLDEAHYLEPMFNEAIEMVRDSIRSFVENDIELASTIRPRDKKLDQLNRDVADVFTARMSEKPERAAELVNLLLIGRNVERVGDHAKNIAEEAIYVTSAEDVRHSGGTKAE